MHAASLLVVVCVCLPAIAASSLGQAAALEASFAGRTTLMGPGHLFLQISQITRILSVEEAVLGAEEFVSLVISGPNRFIFLETAGYTFQSSTNQTLTAGGYHVYLLTNLARVQLVLVLEGLDGFQRFQMEPAEGSVKRLVGADEAAGVPFSGTYPAGIESARFEAKHRGIIVIIENGILRGPSGASIDVARHGVRGSSGLTESDCRLRGGTFGAVLVPGSSVNVSFSHLSIFAVEEGSWKASVEYAGLGGVWLRQHRAFGTSVALYEDDPILQETFSFWDMGPLLAPLTDALPPAVKALGATAACAEPPADSL